MHDVLVIFKLPDKFCFEFFTHVLFGMVTMLVVGFVELLQGCLHIAFFVFRFLCVSLSRKRNKKKFMPLHSGTKAKHKEVYAAA
jgi:Ca2+/Na+ antiporter